MQDDLCHPYILQVLPYLVISLHLLCLNTGDSCYDIQLQPQYRCKRVCQWQRRLWGDVYQRGGFVPLQLSSSGFHPQSWWQGMWRWDWPNLSVKLDISFIYLTFAPLLLYVQASSFSHRALTVALYIANKASRTRKFSQCYTSLTNAWLSISVRCGRVCGRHRRLWSHLHQHRGKFHLLLSVWIQSGLGRRDLHRSAPAIHVYILLQPERRTRSYGIVPVCLPQRMCIH